MFNTINAIWGTFKDLMAGDFPGDMPKSFSANPVVRDELAAEFKELRGEVRPLDTGRYALLDYDGMYVKDYARARDAVRGGRRMGIAV